MSIDEIRQQKGLALLECQEAEKRVQEAQGELRHLAGTLERIAHLLDPGEQTPSMRPLNLNALQDGGIRKALDYGLVLQMATEMAEALAALVEAQKKKRELGL